MRFGFGFGIDRPPFGIDLRSLFAAGEQGFWYDPSDFSTLYQDAAGTTPVTALGQSVGLMLDKSKGLVLGPELVSNGDFSGGATGWSTTGLVTISGGAANFNAALNGANVLQSVALSTSKFYAVTYTITSISSGSVSAAAGGTLGTVRSAPGTYTDILLPIASTIYVRARADNTTAVIDNISVRELPGNHAYQSTALSRPTVEARVNLLTQTGDLSNVAWSRVGVTVSGNRVTASSTNAIHIFYQTFPYVLNQSVSYRIQVAKKAGFGFFQLCYSNSQRVKCTLNLATGEYVVSSVGGASAVVTVTDTGTGRFEVTITGTNSVASGASYFNCGLTTALSGVPVNSYDEPIFMGNGEYMDLYEPDLRLASDSAYPYQRVNTAIDYVDVGAPRYLQFDGTDDGMATPSIDFTGTDKMTVWAGVRKLSDAAIGVVVELSASSGANNGSFYLAASASSGQNYQLVSKGTVLAAATPSGIAAPITNVLTGIGDISGDLCMVRVNGTATSATTDQGTGNYGNYPLYIGRRGGTSLPFNGRLYGLIVRGAASSASQIAAAEAWMNRKTRAY